MILKAISKNPALLKAAVYGANDGIITTFAVVAGVAGAGLNAKVVLILGIANMIADGLSMGLGDFLGERSERKLKAHQKDKDDCECKNAWHTGLITFVAFVIAGTFPLIPYLLQMVNICSLCFADQFKLSIIFTALILFAVGSLRTLLTKGSWIKNGLEMLGIGAIAAVVAYGLGMWVESMVSG
ncbi:MAG: VIT1/CCC1 transporter family protein [Patescibacteria group bacterium]